MSYTELGYSYSAAPQILLSSNTLGSCYESGSDSPFDPAQASLYCPVYESTLVTSSRRDLSSPYENGYTKDHGTYCSYRTDSACLYSLGKITEKREPGMVNRGIAHGPTYYSYNHPFGYHYDSYGYGSVDVNTRRKNATRETTSTLKAWLQEHKKNPYPTKGEKIMLAIITKMTLTQVSTWFANARRRLKKENKMTWCPRNKNSDERGCEEEAEDIEGVPIKSENEFDDNPRVDDTDPTQSDIEDYELAGSDACECEPKPLLPMSAHAVFPDCPDFRLKEPLRHASNPEIRYSGFEKTSLGPMTGESHCLEPEETRPKIWSLAQTATSLNQTDYTSCMHWGRGMRSPSTDCHLDFEVSPFASLRNWVDGMFHEPLLRQNDLNQTFSNSSSLWMLENRLHELTNSVPSPQLTSSS